MSMWLEKSAIIRPGTGEYASLEEMSSYPGVNHSRSMDYSISTCCSNILVQHATRPANNLDSKQVLVHLIRFCRSFISCVSVKNVQTTV